MRWTKEDWLLIAAISGVALILRLYKLGEIPPGFQFDEAFNAIDAQQVLEGNRPLFLPANAGREVLYTYWQAFIVKFVGWLSQNDDQVTVYNLRLASALGGIAAVPLIFYVLRTGLTQNARLIAAFVALAEAINMWHIHFSHFGIRVILMPVMFTVAFALFWKASIAATRKRQTLLYVLSGVAVGLTVWNHPTGRFAPFVLIAYAFWLWWSAEPAAKSRAMRTSIGGLVISGVVAFLVFLPLGIEFYEHPDFFYAHAADSSILNEDVSGGSPLRALLNNVVSVAGMFSFRGDEDWTHNLPRRPVFDILMSLPFVIGLVIWIGKIGDKSSPDRNLYAILLMWLLIMLFPSILSNDAPDFSRTLPSHPAIMVAPGLGLAWIWRRNWSANWSVLGPVCAMAIVLVSGILTFYSYFVDFASQTELYYAYDVDKLDALNRLSPFTATHSVYLSEIWAGHATSTFLRGQYGIQSIETSDTLVLPPVGRGAIYAFPDEQAERADDLSEIFPAATAQTLYDPYARPLLHMIQVSAESLANWPPDFEPEFEHEVAFDEAPTLVGMKSNEMDGSIFLFWRAQVPMLRDLTSFIHLLDEDGHKVGQVDKTPGNGSYPTPSWLPGERVIDRYWPTVTEPCTGGTTARAVTGWYEYAADGRERPRIDGLGPLALAGRMVMPFRAQPANQLVPDEPTNVNLGEQVTLVGFSQSEGILEAKKPHTVRLIWEGNGDEMEIDLQLEQGRTVYPLWTGPLSVQGDWQPGTRLCRQLRLRLPADLEPGSGQLTIQSANMDQPVVLSELAVHPSSQRTPLPDDIESLPVRFSDELAQNVITLLGYRLDSVDSRSVQLTLAWQAETIIDATYSVFVHVLDDSGTLVAQSDRVPGDVATNRWVPDAVMLDGHTINELPSSSLKFRVGLYDPLTGLRLIAAGEPTLEIHNNAAQLFELNME